MTLKAFLAPSESRAYRRRISQLYRQAIDQDQGSPDHADQRFGPRVRDWIGKTVSRAGSTAWKVAIGAAGHLLAAALAAYYGFKS
jgi:hypothetical protein